MRRQDIDTEPSTITARELLEMVEQEGERMEDHYSIALLMAGINAAGLRGGLERALEGMPASSLDFVPLRNWWRTLGPLPDYLLAATHRHLNLAQPVADLEHWRRHRRE